ncbi:hypothetical protein Zmor_010063 [Zophobas morio]|uniref:Uncharacterized protein n=1 Tax=Zophobas morio TaxID=2755281 RepID=A0AA38II39_9CUCU|nr:hypothetical protein Zmor_010063 [Zophobas morio]
MAQYPLYRWVDSSINDENVPATAFQITTTTHGHPVYAGKTPFEDVVLPVNVIPKDKKATLALNGKEHAVDKYKLLCLNQVKWVPSQNGIVLPGAVQAGHNMNDIPLYIGRVFHEESWIVGAINPKYEVCYYPYQGKELSAKKYEALVCEFYQE